MDFTPSPSSGSNFPIEDDAENPHAVAALWGGAITPASGFVAIPMVLLRVQTKLKLTATDMLVMANLLAHRWKVTDAVFPRTTTIAKRMGVTPRTVQRSAEKLIRGGVMERVKRADGLRSYRFDKLNRILAREVEASLLIKSQESLDA